jgi:hypothetical protein
MNWRKACSQAIIGRVELRFQETVAFTAPYIKIEVLRAPVKPQPVIFCVDSAREKHNGKGTILRAFYGRVGILIEWLGVSQTSTIHASETNTEGFN